MVSGRLEPKVFIILLNLNGYQFTRDCLQSLRSINYSNYEVIVVDNGSSDNSGVLIGDQFPEVRLVRSEKNLGFSAGNNLGIEAALKLRADYVLLLNNDTVVDADFLTHLVGAGEGNTQVGILGPKIFYASEPNRIWYAGGYVRSSSGTCGHVGWNEIDDGNRFFCTEETGWVTGCAILVKTRVLQELGPLDPSLFIYCEDIDFCLRARGVGYRCVFVPGAKIWHKVSQTCGLDSSFTLYLGTRNHLTWIKRHIPFPHKATALAFTLMKKMLKANFLLFKNRDLAGAVWSGILAFAFKRYGPPDEKMLPKRQNAGQAKSSPDAELRPVG